MIDIRNLGLYRCGAWALLGANNDVELLCHHTRMTQNYTPVNPLFASMH